MKLLALLLLSMASSGCGQVAVSNGNNETQTAQREDTIVPGTALEMDVAIIGNPANPQVSGTTNLPSGTKLYALVVKGEKVRGEADMTVNNRRFSTTVMGPKGGLLPGTYQIEIDSPLVEFQPPDVLAMLGRDYENLTGPKFDDKDAGRTIHYELKHVVPRVAAATAKTKLREQDDARAYEFAQRTCTERQTNAGKATRTPKAVAEITACTKALVAEIKAPD